MHRQAMTLLALLLVALTAGCFGEQASAVPPQTQAEKTPSETQPAQAQEIPAPSDSTATAATQTEAPPADTEQPDTAKPETTPSAKPAATPAAATPPSAGAASPDNASDDETLAVETANRQFYDCLNQVFTGKTSAMDDVWSHSDRVTSMGPGGGIGTGWDEVQALWDEQAKMKLGGMVGPEDLHVTVGADLAIVECYEVGSNRDPLGAELPVRIRVTNSFRKENGQWKMIGHHTDLLPYLSGPLGPVGKPSSANLSNPGDPRDTDTIIVKPDKVKLKLID